MPRDEKELERCERTVYVNQIDRAVPGSAVEAMFESFCGAHLAVPCNGCSMLVFDKNVHFKHHVLHRDMAQLLDRRNLDSQLRVLPNSLFRSGDLKIVEYSTTCQK